MQLPRTPKTGTLTALAARIKLAPTSATNFVVAGSSWGVGTVAT